MILDQLNQLIAEAEATLRQREMQEEEERQVAERKRAEAVEKARNSLIAWLDDLLNWNELQMYEVDTKNLVFMVDGDIRRVEYGIKFALPQIEPFWAKICGDSLYFSSEFNGYEVKKSAFGEFILERRRAYEKYAKQRARDLEIAKQVIAVAREFMCEQEKYDYACRQWAEHWTALLWRPWIAWLVRYVPIFSNPTIIGLRNYDEIDFDFSDIFIKEAMVLGDQPPIGQTVVRVITKYGELTDCFIGAILDAKPVRFDTPSIDKPIEYHRIFHAGKFCVNVMPTIDLNLSIAPQAPTWIAKIACIDMQGASQSLLAKIDFLSPGEIAGLDEQRLVDFGRDYDHG